MKSMKSLKRWISVLTVLCLLSALPGALSETLKKGSQGEAVEEVQQWLINLGYLNDVADGKFGKKTEKAVKAFQKTLGVKQSGRLTDEQQEQLMFLYFDITGVMEGDGADPEELKQL